MIYSDLISVIVPVYNKEKVIEKCITNIGKQSYENIEIIVVDDGSTDGSLEIIRKLASKDKRIIVIQQKNSGPGAARNTGLKNASGKYIQFVDADDSIDNNMIKTLYDYLDDRVDIVVCGYNQFDNNGNVNEVIEKEFNEKSISDVEIVQLLVKWLDSPYIGAPWNKLYKRKMLLDNNIFFPETQTWGEDFVFNIKVFSNSAFIRLVDKALYNYDRGDLSLSKTNHIKYGKDLFLFWNLKRKAYSEFYNMLVKRNANYEDLLKIQILGLEYAYSIIHLAVNKLSLSKINQLVKIIRKDLNLDYDGIVQHKRFFSFKYFARAILLKYYSGVFFCVFEIVFYNLVVFIRKCKKYCNNIKKYFKYGKVICFGK